MVAMVRQGLVVLVVLVQQLMDTDMVQVAVAAPRGLAAKAHMVHQHQDTDLAETVILLPLLELLV
jgi:hypothetical protein